MKRTILLFFIFVTTYNFAQNILQNKANYNIEHLNYWSAKSQFKRLLENNSNELENSIKLATCYKQLHENEQGYQLLKPLYSAKGFNAASNYKLYGELCLLTQRYDEAKTSFEIMGGSYFSEGKQSMTIANMDLKERLSWKSNFEINTLTLNSTKADFGGYPYLNNSIIIVSSRGNRPIKRIWAGNGENFLDLYIYSDNGKIKRFKSGFNAKYHEGPLCIHPNGKWVYFTRNNVSKGKYRRDEKGIQNLKIYRADVMPDGKWKHITELKINSSAFSVGHPSISSDGNTIYFSSDMPGGFGKADIYSGTLNEQGEVVGFKNLGKEINTQGNELFSWIHLKQLFFASDGQPGLGGLDIHVTNLKHNGVFAVPKNIGSPLNSNSDDFGIIFNSVNKGFFSSNRSGFGSDDIYSFVLKEPIRILYNIAGIVNENFTNDIIPNQILFVYNDKGRCIDTLVTDSQGRFDIDVIEGDKITIKSSKGSYDVKSWEYTATNNENQTLTLLLDGRPQLTINTIVTDKKTDNPIENVEISVKDRNTGKQIIIGNTNQEGSISELITDLEKNQKLIFEVKISKSGYLEKIVTAAYTITKSETINLHEIMDMGIGRIEIGGNLAELIDIKPIYFDLGKYNIRSDAATELDKIVSIMNQYPKMVVELGSHTDCRSSKVFNQKLSLNRARASSNYIKSKITTPTRISGVGYGESKLKVNCPCEGTIKSTCSEEEHAKNRRTEFIIKKVN